MIPYVDALSREIADTAELLKKLNKRVRCVYIGGGTPTALTEELFEKVLNCATVHFKPYLEFTVEAGRPDTITERKLIAMKETGVGRISINPQSMNAETLKKIGRSHSPEEIRDCFSLARSIGFKTINVILHSVCAFLLHAMRNMPVYIQRKGCSCMPNVILHSFYVITILQGKHCKGMTHIMESGFG